MCQGSMLDTGGLQKQGTAILKELLCNEITFISYFTLETFKEFFQLSYRPSKLRIWRSQDMGRGLKRAS